MSCDVGEALLIFQAFRRFTYVTAHSPTLPSLYLRHRSFSNPSVASPTSQLISSAHSPSFPSLHLRHSLFSNPSLALPTSQVILQPFRCFTYITIHQLCSFSKLSVASPPAHSPTLPSLYLRHRSFSNPSVASPTSQLILQPSFRVSYVTGFSLTALCEPPMA